MDFRGLHEEYIQFLETIFFTTLGKEVSILEYQFLSGGCINQTIQATTSAGTFFVKWNESMEEDFFACEAKGLTLLKEAGEISVPEVIGYGQNGQKTYLILEFLPFTYAKSNYWADLGTSLARLHTHSQPEFGLSYPNYIGSLPQTNTAYTNGVDFFIECRLKPQVGLAVYNQLMPQTLYTKFQHLYTRLPDIFPNEKPALLHGDLWHGNVLIGKDGYATLIDPAVYYGNREAEIAFTYLFGGFEPDFYDAYVEATPLEPGFTERKAIYNLYPLLVHLNLFGSGYLSGIEQTLQPF
ncbi:fructosamine kinase family protein [Xanthocytophaga agilis]|uniref:Fructosamine kinase family protein n=1 Tax=Xanthocytophaga agilis TaxID=3048010 RepID=A0AAE3RBB3_9BACT|nr:fructosamine kinase family protein [Xanthocytophaga agilis]MDJ1504954.1 fructosamine kinase family protein [Xanthocytophaga agilis]